MKFRFSSFFRKSKKKKESLPVKSAEKEQPPKIVIECKHFILPISTIEIIDFEISLGELSILPNEVLELILSHLTPAELLSAALSSKGFWVMCTDDVLWKSH